MDCFALLVLGRLVHMRLMVRLAALTGALALVPAATAAAATQIATDPGTGGAGQHHTIVEPDSFGFGSTIVTAAQAGRVFDGGSDAVSLGASPGNGPALGPPPPAGRT